MNIIREIEFWTQIMRDHAKFLCIALSGRETEAAEKVNAHYLIFAKLYEHAGLLPEELNPEVIPSLIAENKTAVIDFTQYKKMLLEKLMAGDVELSLFPSFLNHMISEAMEFYRVLCIADDSLRYNRVLENIRLHRIWLPDAAGHAHFIASGLDGLEKDLMAKTVGFEKMFNALFIKSHEMYLMYERTSRRNGELEYFNEEIRAAVLDYNCYIQNLEKLKTAGKIFGSGQLSVLHLKHMAREGEYYLMRIDNLGITGDI